LIEKRIEEEWESPDWRRLDILHSATMSTEPVAPRKSQYKKTSKTNKSQLTIDDVEI